MSWQLARLLLLLLLLLERLLLLLQQQVPPSALPAFSRLASLYFFLQELHLEGLHVGSHAEAQRTLLLWAVVRASRAAFAFVAILVLLVASAMRRRRGRGRG